MRLVFGCIVSAALLASAVAGSEANRKTVCIIADAQPAPPVKHALAELESALRKKKLNIDHTPRNADTVIHVGTPKDSNAIAELVADSLPGKSEALCIRKKDGDRPRMVLAGTDARGVSYAVREAARAIDAAATDAPFAGIEDISESPYLAVRSVTIHLFNEDVEKDWYHSEKFWRGYFGMLADQRFNHFTLVFGDQCNYLNPLYAYLLDVPGYPGVTVKGLTAEGKRRNLAALKRISELAVEYGIDFNLGIWMQMPEPRYPSPILVEGMPHGLEAGKYCAEGLQLLLQACPAISGLQFRMNYEAGVSEELQTDFFRPIFEAIRDCGRRIRLDLRYKGLRPDTLRLALQMGLDVTVSSKFWCEHFGLPYHPTDEDTHYRDNRYGYGAMLPYPRSYKVMYRLWTVGTQRLLLWGDPDYAAQFARSCRLGDGQGFEVFAPLSNKGYGNAPGYWPIHSDPAYRHYEWEYERYWAFYLAFGRMGYNPDTKVEIWQREFRRRFGAAAAGVEQAYRTASQVLPLITATHLPSASEWSWWPEMDTGDRLPEYIRAQPSDRAQFYAIRTWQATPKWRCERWDEFVPGFVEDAVAGKVRGKWTPFMISRRLQDLATKTVKHLDQLAVEVDEPAELRATQVDLRMIAALANFHAEKMLAGTHYGFFEKTGAGGRLPIALRHIENAERIWREDIAGVAEGVYHHNLVFGTTPQNARNLFGHHHSGHWRDRVKELQAEVVWLRELTRKTDTDKPFHTYPGETPLKSTPQVQHTPPALPVLPSDDLRIAVRVRSEQPVKNVIVHFRAVNQTANWKEFPARQTGAGSYEVVISSKEITGQWDYMYYVETLVDGGGSLWPSWEQGQPYVVVQVKR